MRGSGPGKESRLKEISIGGCVVKTRYGRTGGNKMSLREPRCLVCGAPLSLGAPFESDVRDSEVCSDKCYGVYMYNEDEDEIELTQKDWRE